MTEEDTQEAFADDPLADEKRLELYEQHRKEEEALEDTPKAPKWCRKRPRLVSCPGNLPPVVAFSKCEFVGMSGTSKLIHLHFFALYIIFMCILSFKCRFQWGNCDLQY